MVMSVPVFHTSTRMLRRSLTVATSSAKTLFELAASEPKYGVGARFFRKNWVKNDYAPEQHHYSITRISLASQRAWGLKCWKGEQSGSEELVRGAEKRDWYVLRVDDP